MKTSPRENGLEERRRLRTEIKSPQDRLPPEVPRGLALYREDHIEAVIEEFEEFIWRRNWILAPRVRATLILVLCDNTKHIKSISEIKKYVKDSLENIKKPMVCRRRDAE